MSDQSLKISVVICIFNGENFVGPQLESVLNQAGGLATSDLQERVKTGESESDWVVWSICEALVWMRRKRQ